MSDTPPPRLPGAVIHPYGPHPYHYPGAWGEALGLTSPEALDLRHAGHARLLTEAEIREIEREQGHRL